MTNKELLHASLLDILFDGRNKEYGAYALRKHYHHRLLLALGLGLSLILLFPLAGLLAKEDVRPPGQPEKDRYHVVPVALKPEEKKPDPVQKPDQAPRKKPEAVASVRNTTLKLVRDDELKRTEVPDIHDLKDKRIDIQNILGKRFEGIAEDRPPVLAAGNRLAEEAKPEPLKPSSPPAFPGGFEALRKFLFRNLVTPSTLEMGETVMVKVKFVVDTDGSVSAVAIVSSGGRDFDKEVIRVCHKMPAWKPAIQNGAPVKTTYVLPVTFMGAEQ